MVRSKKFIDELVYRLVGLSVPKASQLQLKLKCFKLFGVISEIQKHTYAIWRPTTAVTLHIYEVNIISDVFSNTSNRIIQTWFWDKMKMQQAEVVGSWIELDFCLAHGHRSILGHGVCRAHGSVDEPGNTVFEGQCWEITARGVGVWCVVQNQLLNIFSRYASMPTSFCFWNSVTKLSTRLPLKYDVLDLFVMFLGGKSWGSMDGVLCRKGRGHTYLPGEPLSNCKAWYPLYEAK